MRMHKERITKGDGRYLIYYTFEEDGGSAAPLTEQQPAAPLANEPRNEATEPNV